MSSRSRMGLVPSCLSVCLMLAGGSVWAQATGASAPGTTPAAAAAATDNKAQLSDVERAKRDADKVFQWIKFHAEKGETKKPEHQAKTDAKPEPKPQPAVAKSAAPAPARKSDEDSRTVVAAASDSQRGDAGGGMTRTSLTSSSAGAASTTPPAYTGRIPESMAMAAPATAPVVGAPAAPAQQPEPEPAPLPEEDTPLRLVNKVDPEYPRALLTQQRNGSVMVKFVVQTDGSVEQVEAIKSPDRKLSVAAVAAVKQWRFAPINKPRPVSVEIGFQME
ncbi:energy transducer TonB [Roseateles terrae]|uniref:Protein TonB n=1 Tax=Roseateles terrae TaxID=431060 RepID=A0ABR6H0G6_9BURK|nr:energy transducer TonB [Roseateles terrae]MBB3197263.1 TonB family protein [Roseateles terrae]